MKFADDINLPDWELLRSWVAVIEGGSVLEAARLLNVSQAAISQRVKQLEAIFDTTLLDRTTRPARPTASGQRLFENATDLITRSKQMMESVRNVSRARRMIVRIGCVDSFAAFVGPMMIRALSDSTHQIRLWSGITPMLERQMENRQLDLAITTAPTSAPGITRVPLITEAYVLVVPKTMEMGGLSTIAELARKMDFIRYSARSLIGQQVDAYLQRMGDTVERTCEFDATDPLLSLVASGVGFALTTPMCILQSRQFLPQLQVLPLTAFKKHGRPYPAIHRSFHLEYREGELGGLPVTVRDLIRHGVEKHLVPEVRSAMHLDASALQVHGLEP